ncbi:MAG: hypothetical protein AAF656_07600 [Planctomycetota bacterium]
MYAALFKEVSALLFAADPAGINLGDNADEYDPEAGSILARLPDCSNAEQAGDIVVEEFCHWFGGEYASLEPQLRPLGAEIWRLWQARPTE